ERPAVVGRAIADERQLPERIALCEQRTDGDGKSAVAAAVDGEEQRESRRPPETSAAYAIPDAAKVLVPPRTRRSEPPVEGSQPGAEHDGQDRARSIPREHATIRALARSPILPAAGLARLFRHSTTIDPYLDES